MPGADCGSDHELLLGKIKIRLKGIKKQLRNPRFDVNCITHHYKVEVKNRFAILTNVISNQMTFGMTLSKMF